jgi:membrane protease YdiL (CAAX protease family)
MAEERSDDIVEPDRARGLPEAQANVGLRCLACGTALDGSTICPACGCALSRVHSPDSQPSAELPGPAPPGESLPASGPAAPVDFGPPVMTGRAAWLEVAAVLAVGVVPHLLLALTGFAKLGTSIPYWVDTIELTGISSCIAFVTLYLIFRSGEPWGRFGLAAPAGQDISLGLALLGVAAGTWMCCVCFNVRSGFTAGPFPLPGGPHDCVMMVIKYTANSFAEELVTRAYLITRLEVLVRSRGLAVVLAAVAFASYHVYNGALGLGNAFAFGLAYGTAYLAIRRIWPLVIGHTLFNISVELIYMRFFSAG